MHGVDDRSEPVQLPVPLAGDTFESLGRYSEEENVATAFFETPRPEPTWLVQVTPFDRRLWTRERVLQELVHRGGLIHRDTLVWRDGMNNWRRIAQLDELHGGTPLPPPPRPSRGAQLAPRASLARAALLYGATALLMVSAALYVLRAAGVFAEASVASGSPAPAASMAASVQIR